jgi:hypothetical protein
LSKRKLQYYLCKKIWTTAPSSTSRKRRKVMKLASLFSVILPNQGWDTDLASVAVDLRTINYYGNCLIKMKDF